MIIYVSWHEYNILRNNLIFADKEDRKKICMERLGVEINFVIFPRNCIYLVCEGGDIKIFPR